MYPKNYVIAEYNPFTRVLFKYKILTHFPTNEELNEFNRIVYVGNCKNNKIVMILKFPVELQIDSFTIRKACIKEIKELQGVDNL